MVEKTRVHIRVKPCAAPAEAAVVTVPGPIKAAAMTDQRRIEASRFKIRPFVEGFPSPLLQEFQESDDPQL